MAARAPIVIIKAWGKSSKTSLNPLVYVIKLIKIVKSLLSEIYIIYSIVYASAAVLGIFVNPGFFALLLYDILLRYSK